ncbi:GWxTD domain-containing protein [Bacteroidota bacterium]
MKSLLVILMFCFVSINAQVEYSHPTDNGNAKPMFYIDIANYKSTTAGKTKVDILIQVPYSNIQFIKSGNLYKGGYSVDLRFMDEGKSNIIDEIIWDEKIELNNFEQTLSSTAIMVSYKSTLLDPGNYHVTCYIQDKDSKKSAKVNFDPVVRSFVDSLDISDIILVSHIIQNENGTSIVPNISNLVTSQTKELPFYLEIYTDRDREVFLEYSINELQSGRNFNNMISKKLNEGKNFIFERFRDMNFLLGEYELTVKVKDENWTDIKGRVKKFKSAYADLPASIVNLDKAVDQMIYITRTSQLDSIQNATTFEDKLDRFLKFWETKDPTPGSPNNEALNEYFRRVKYSNVHFKSYFEGWKSDMGWIYIMLGPPDYVGRHPMDLDSKPYEVWEYYDIRRSFTFVDETGFGHYRLVNPQYGDWFRYRY